MSVVTCTKSRRLCRQAVTQTIAKCTSTRRFFLCTVLRYSESRASCPKEHMSCLQKKKWCWEILFETVVVRAFFDEALAFARVGGVG